MASTIATCNRSRARRRIVKRSQYNRDHDRRLLQERTSNSHSASGQILLDTLKHLHFDAEDIRSQTIVHLLRRFERPFAGTAMHTYNLWNEGDGNQRLDFVVSYSLEVFRKIMRNREWKHKFELTFRPIICSRKAFDRTPVLWLVRGYTKNCHLVLLWAQHSFILTKIFRDRIRG